MSDTVFHNQALVGAQLTDKAALAALVVVIEGTKGASLGGGGQSGHVPPGRYELTLRNFEPMKKKEGKDGYNFVFTYEVSGPSAQSGVTIIQRVPAPIGEGNDAKTGNKMIRDMILSSASPFPDQVAKMTSLEKVPVKPFTWIGKKFFAQLADQKDEQYKDSSEIKFMVSQEEFTKRPGPESAEQTAAASGDKGATVTPIHTNGTSAKAQTTPKPDAAADAFGF